MPTFAAIDVGSNSCRLKIARVVSHQLKTLHEDREVTRLGSSVFESGLISPEAMAATLRALKRFQRAVQAHAPDRIRVVATSAMRDARNAAAFQAWVKAETGWDMEVISGLEEGRLIHRGVMSGEPGAAGRVLLIDLGGGSCEITLSESKRIKETISLPLGSGAAHRGILDGQRSGAARGPGADAPVDCPRTATRAAAHPSGERCAGDRHFRYGGGTGRCLCGGDQVRRHLPASANGARDAGAPAGERCRQAWLASRPRNWCAS